MTHLISDCHFLTSSLGSGGFTNRPATFCAKFFFSPNMIQSRQAPESYQQLYHAAMIWPRQFQTLVLCTCLTGEVFREILQDLECRYERAPVAVSSKLSILSQLNCQHKLALAAGLAPKRVQYTIDSARFSQGCAERCFMCAAACFADIKYVRYNTRTA